MAFPETPATAILSPGRGARSVYFYLFTQQTFISTRRVSGTPQSRTLKETGPFSCSPAELWMGRGGVVLFADRRKARPPLGQGHSRGHWVGLGPGRLVLSPELILVHLAEGEGLNQAWE